MTTLLLIVALGLACFYGLGLMTKLDRFLSSQESAANAASPRRARAPRRVKWVRSPLGEHAAVLLHSILNH